ncbi:MAG TPA: MgtC/SapB family protein [Ktedonobacteraceae bacterium]|nr:MgtC/SapB family protein [Ktedonobacteraceae bacterium]
MIPLSTFLLRLGLALLLGALIGLERESTEKAAGLRTNALVALGSCLFTLISGYGFLDLLSIAHIQVDPTRIASYVVAGIGFLGAGSIVMKRDAHTVRGLTTAAAIWLVAAIGMACGAGLLLVAILTTVLGLLVLFFLRLLERFLLPQQFQKSQHMQIEAVTLGEQSVSQICEALAHLGIRVKSLSVRKEQALEKIHIACAIPDAATLARAIDQLRAFPGIQAVSVGAEDGAGTDAS